MSNLDVLKGSDSLLERLEYVTRVKTALATMEASVAQFGDQEGPEWVGRQKALIRKTKDGLSAYDPYRQRSPYPAPEVPDDEWRHITAD